MNLMAILRLSFYRREVRVAVGSQIVTLGCRLNAYESEIIQQATETAGLDNAVIINSCAVTSEAVRQTRQAIRKARRAQPQARIIVTGCAAQIDPEQFADMAEVDLVLGNEEKLVAESYTGFHFNGDRGEKIKVNDIMSVRETAGHFTRGLAGRARAFVQVQNGCDHRCTFCIIPYGRGNSRSVPMGEVVAQIRLLCERGYKEVVLTGVDMTSYGADLPGVPQLGTLVQKILECVPELKRLRLSSIDCIEVDQLLLRLITEQERVMPHLHLSLQAGDNIILKRMKRRHLRDQAIGFCAQVKSARPDVVFGADLIAGFPTETDEMFENTLRLVEECELTFLHVFPYSQRPGTPAARMPQIPGDVIKGRARQLRDLGAARLTAWLERQVGQDITVLVENKRRGRSDHYAVVQFDRDMAPGDVTRVRVSGVQGEGLTGMVL